ncbi:MAG: hypothetical protein QM790_12360 [Nibricoccus sp.]
MSVISQLLAKIDDASWEALASKGLLRRATKELEKGVVCTVETETPFVLTAKVADWIIKIPADGPAKAKCTCGAPGCCHHVIIAGLFLRNRGPCLEEEDPESSSKTEPRGSSDKHSEALQVLLGLDYAIVKRWCGAGAWRAALRLVASGVVADIREDSGIIGVHLMPIEASCRFLPNVGLDGAIVAGGDTKSVKPIVAAALVLLKKQRGQALPEGEIVDGALEEEKGAPRSREEVLFAAKTALEIAIEDGVTHAIASTAEKFATLAVSADGTNLPRLARNLKTVADELGMIASRHGRADAERTVDAMAFAYALVSALQKTGDRPPAYLVGQHRTGYVDVSMLELLAVTGFPWQTRSGYKGVTVLFWDIAGNRWMTWTEARSTSADPRYDPLKAFDADGPWSLSGSIRSMLSKRLSLSGAKRNNAGRLSGAKTCKATVQGALSFSEIDFCESSFSSWEALLSYVTKTSPHGLRQSDPMTDWVVLDPTNWGDRQFDRIEQRLTWPVIDADGREMVLALMYSDLTRSAIDALEAFDPFKTKARIVGRILRNAAEVAVEPIALLLKAGESSPVIHLQVPPKITKASNAPTIPVATSAPAEDEELEGTPDEMVVGPMRNRWLIQCRNRVIARAESGANYKKVSEDDLMPQKLMDIGLPVLSDAFAGLDKQGSDLAPALLRAAYLICLHEQYQAVGSV